MGGRGTFAAGNNVPYTYKTVGKIYGTKILVGMGGLHDLPEESHTSNIYVKLNDNGSVRQLRVYNDDHTRHTDIEKSPHQGKIYLHAHDYVNGVRQKARDLTPEELKIYKKYFGG